MSSKFFTNRDSNTLLEKFSAIFQHRQDIARLDVLVGYFRATGYFKLRPLLENLSQIRVLIGIDVDQITNKAQSKGYSLSLGVNANEVTQDYSKKLCEEIESADYDNDLEQSFIQFVNDISTKKVLLKAHPSRKLHAKIYLMLPEKFNEHCSGEVITGSSNLSEVGLGSSKEKNYEFNVLLRDYDDVKFASDEFNQLWDEATEILPEILNQVKNKSHLRDDITPFQLYIKLLIEYFGNEVEFNPDNIGDLPPNFVRLKYQMDAVEQGCQLLKKHNGFFLSDVVGLGKTVIAVMIARQFFLYNNYPHYRSHILIVCPPALKDAWTRTVEQFHIDDNVSIITNGSLFKIVEDINPEKRLKYDLIIVDESHAFRNSNQDRYRDLEIITKGKCRDGSQKRVILVSATPLNNGPSDLKNQILLFQDSNNSTLDMNIEKYFNIVIKKYNDLLKNPSDKNELKQLIEEIRIKAIEPITVRRTRTDLQADPQYNEDLQKQRIYFPKVNSPEKLLYQLNPTLSDLYDHSISVIAGKDDNFRYGAYRLIEFLKPDHKKDYARADFIVERLKSLMKTLLLKRLDSSFYAFNKSLGRFVKTLEFLIKMFQDNKIYIAPDYQVQKYIEDDKEDELFDVLIKKKETDPSIKILAASDFESDLIPILIKDYETLKQLQQQWENILSSTPDPKIIKLLQVLQNKILNQNTNPTGKLVIFSESSDTTHYLKDVLTREKYKVLMVTYNSSGQSRAEVEKNFDANYTGEQKDDYSIIIATEILAEGVNLHRANSIVNYDTPWNATRLMQRIGRINRIGSNFSDIYIYNFFPTEKVEDDIGLRQRAQKKLQAFHTALGEDSQIYTTDEQFGTFGLFDREIQESENLTDRFKHLIELRTFKKNNPDEYQHIKNLPLKIRTAIASRSPSQVGTICFLRNSNQNAFYFVGADNVAKRIGFFEAVNYFASSKNQQSEAVPISHFEHVQQCISEFIKEKEVLKTQQISPKLLPRQSQAIQYLKALNDYSSLTNDAQKQKLNKAIEWIGVGRYQNFYKDINKIHKNSQKPKVAIATQLSSIIKLIDNYSSTDNTTSDNRSPTSPNYKNDTPKIVISQSYK